MPNPFATARSALITAGVILLVAFVAFMLWKESSGRAVQGKQDSRSGVATAETAKDAAATVIARSRADADVDLLVADTVERIESETNAHVSGQLARDAICSFEEYANDPSCL